MSRDAGATQQIGPGRTESLEGAWWARRWASVKFKPVPNKHEASVSPDTPGTGGRQHMGKPKCTLNKNGINRQQGSLKTKKHLVMYPGEGLKKKKMYSK